MTPAEERLATTEPKTPARDAVANEVAGPNMPLMKAAYKTALKGRRSRIPDSEIDDFWSAAQVGYVIALKNWRSGGGASLSTMVYLSVRHEVNRCWVKRKPTSQLDEIDAKRLRNDALTMEERYVETDRLLELRRCMAALPPDEQALLIGRVRRDGSNRRMAKERGVSHQWLSELTTAAFQRLAKEVRKAA